MMPSYDVQLTKLVARLNPQMIPLIGSSHWLNNLTRKTFLRAAKENPNRLARILFLAYPVELVLTRIEMADSHREGQGLWGWLIYDHISII